MKLLQVQGSESLARDLDSGAVVNLDSSSYEEYIKKRQANLSIKNKIKEQDDAICNINKDLQEIKEILKSLVTNKYCGNDTSN